MKEKLSALVDGEASGEDLEPRLARLKGDAELRRAWDTYHLIGDALRGDIGADLCARVSARLAGEPVLLAPRRHAALPDRAARYALSAAAVVAAVALVIWTALPLMRPEPAQLAASPAPVVAGAPPVEASPRLAAAQVENYLLAHQPYSHASALQGLAPYVRTVADEREESDK